MVTFAIFMANLTSIPCFRRLMGYMHQFRKQVVFLYPQKPKTEGFRLPPPRGGRGRGLHPLSPFTFVQIMENKTKTFKFRVTQTQFENIKRRSKPFGTMTNFINQAVKEFSDITIKEKLDMEKHIAEQYVDIDAKLAHAGANLNQVVRRINELAQAGLPYEQILMDNAMPRIKEVYDIVNQFRNEIRESTMLALRGKKR